LQALTSLSPSLVRPAPHRSKRAQARRVQQFQKVQVAIDRFAAFEMQHHRETAPLDRRTNLRSRLAKRHGALRAANDLHQDRQFAERGFSRLLHRQRSRKRHRISPARHLLAQRREIAGRRRVHRKQAAHERAGPRFLQVDMAGVFASQKIRHRITGCRLVETQQNIVVPVENRNIGRHAYPLYSNSGLKRRIFSASRRLAVSSARASRFATAT
jgi:hypothetical protein